MQPPGIQGTGRDAPLPIVVLISGNGSNLQAIIDAIVERGLPARIHAVISNRADAFGLERARRAGIPTEILDHREFTSREDYDHTLMSRIDAHKPALVVLAGFMRILTPALVEHYLGRMLNIHPSLLPKYRGLETHRRALEDGELEHGCTVHFVTPDLDSGPVVLQAAVPVRPDDDAAELARRVQAQEHLIYPLAIRWFAEGRLRLADGQALLDGHPIEAADYHGNPELAG